MMIEATQSLVVMRSRTDLQFAPSQAPPAQSGNRITVVQSPSKAALELSRSEKCHAAAIAIRVRQLPKRAKIAAREPFPRKDNNKIGQTA